MFIIALLTPGERINCMPGRFPDSPGKRPSHPFVGQWCKNAFLLITGFTVAGTVPELHRISFYTANRRLPYHQSGGKDRKIFDKTGEIIGLI